MHIGTMTSKGQTTIPQDVREKLNLKPGDKLMWFVEDGRAVVRPKNRTLEELSGMLHRPGMKAMTLEEIEEGIAEGAIRSALGE